MSTELDQDNEDQKMRGPMKIRTAQRLVKTGQNELGETGLKLSFVVLINPFKISLKTGVFWSHKDKKDDLHITDYL